MNSIEMKNINRSRMYFLMLCCDYRGIEYVFGITSLYKKAELFLQLYKRRRARTKEINETQLFRELGNNPHIPNDLNRRK